MTQRPIKYAVQVVSALVAVKPGAVASLKPLAAAQRFSSTAVSIDPIRMIIINRYLSIFYGYPQKLARSGC